MVNAENIYKYTWRMFEKDVKTLCKRVDFSNYDYLCGIATGGLPLLTKLVNVTGKPYIIIKCSSYDDKTQGEFKTDFSMMERKVVEGKRILLVDDVADSGKTLRMLAAELAWRAASSVEGLTLFYKPQSVVVPEWYVHEVENHQWITFPWE